MKTGLKILGCVGVFVVFCTCIVAAFALGHFIGKQDGNINTGSPAFFLVDDIRERLKRNDDGILPDLEKLLAEMEPKNKGGVNGPAMVRYLKRLEEQRAAEEYTSRTATGAATK
jgi:hypothetical protein